MGAGHDDGIHLACTYRRSAMLGSCLDAGEAKGGCRSMECRSIEVRTHCERFAQNTRSGYKGIRRIHRLPQDFGGFLLRLDSCVAQAEMTEPRPFAASVLFVVGNEYTPWMQHSMVL